MTEIYMSRWHAISTTVLIPLLAVVYWVCCYHVIPIDAPNVSAAFSRFVEGVMIFGAVVMAFVIYLSLSQLRIFLHRTPIVVITNDKLQIYDFTYNCHRVFDWKDVVKIEKVSMKNATHFDVFVRNEERYQIIETTRWCRFMQKLNKPFLRGAAVRITPTTLNISNRELFNMLQSHINK